ncbi:acetyl-CoA carboxylase biotin carboxyl carrier protein subunit, partial [Saccharopolyspora erythraea]|uniref:acetyl-CoA carboxylase biotin carboxyl carrier protein subunit n=1 Tax=Saccharopolyspora erythraea TaxID=1836 RepID=UPI001EFA918B
LALFDGARPAEAGVGRGTVVVEVGGRRLEVSLPADLTPAAAPAGGAGRPRRRSAGGGGAGSSGDAVTAPMQGTLVKLVVAEGDRVSAGDEIAVLEAMKMENPVLAHKDGTVTGLTAQPGATLTQGSTLCELKD